MEVQGWVRPLPALLERPHPPPVAYILGCWGCSVGPGGGRVDVILAADVTYYKAYIPVSFF